MKHARVPAIQGPEEDGGDGAGKALEDLVEECFQNLMKDLYPEFQARKDRDKENHLGTSYPNCRKPSKEQNQKPRRVRKRLWV